MKSPRVNLPSFGLPPGFERLNDKDFEFDEPLPRRIKKQLDHKAKIRLSVLARWKAKWDAEELKWLKLRAAQLAIQIEADKRWLAEQAERDAARERTEAELKRVRDWFTNELAKEAAKARRT